MHQLPGSVLRDSSRTTFQMVGDNPKCFRSKFQGHGMRKQFPRKLDLGRFRSLESELIEKRVVRGCGTRDSRYLDHPCIQKVFL